MESEEQCCSDDREIRNDLKESPLNRVTAWPIVAYTCNAAQNYYQLWKKKYPVLSPFLKLTENLTETAFSIASTAARPLVDRFGPTVNGYAGALLDKIEEKFPIVTKTPKQTNEEAKDGIGGLFSGKVNGLLSTLEHYVDYYLPGDDDQKVDVVDENMEDADYNEEEADLSDAEYDDEDSSGEEGKGKAKDEKKMINIRLRIRDIAYKIWERSTERISTKWRALEARCPKIVRCGIAAILNLIKRLKKIVASLIAFFSVYILKLFGSLVNAVREIASFVQNIVRRILDALRRFLPLSWLVSKTSTELSHEKEE